MSGDTDSERDIDEITREVESALATAEFSASQDALSMVRFQRKLSRKINRLLAQRIDELEDEKASREDLADLQDHVQELEQEVEALKDQVRELERNKERLKA